MLNGELRREVLERLKKYLPKNPGLPVQLNSGVLRWPISASLHDFSNYDYPKNDLLCCVLGLCSSTQTPTPASTYTFPDELRDVGFEIYNWFDHQYDPEAVVKYLWG